MPLSHSEFSGCRWVLPEKEAATQTEYKQELHGAMVQIGCSTEYHHYIGETVLSRGLDELNQRGELKPGQGFC